MDQRSESQFGKRMRMFQMEHTKFYKNDVERVKRFQNWRVMI